MIVLGDFLYQELPSEKVVYIFSKSKLLIKTLSQIKGLLGEQQRTLCWSFIMSCVPSIVSILWELKLSSVSTINHLIDLGVCAVADCTNFIS